MKKNAAKERVAKKIVHGDGTEKNNLHITIPEKKFRASSKSPRPPQKLNGRPLTDIDSRTLRRLSLPLVGYH